MKILLEIFSLGRLRIHNQFNPLARFRIVADGPVFVARLYCLFDVFHFGSAVLNASPVRRIPAGSNFRAYGGGRRFRVDKRVCVFEIRPRFHVPSRISLRFFRRSHRRRRNRFRDGGSADVFRLYCTVERTILFIVGHRIC